MPNEGVRSSWNGHSPSYRAEPARRSSVRAETSSTKSTASRTRSLDSVVYRAIAATLAGEGLRHVELPQLGPLEGRRLRATRAWRCRRWRWRLGRDQLSMDHAESWQSL